MCIVVAGSSLGGVCFPIMFNKLFKTVGFGESVNYVPRGPLLTAPHQHGL